MNDTRAVFAELQNLVTEGRNPRSRNIDTAPVSEILQIINDEDITVPGAVRLEIPYIAKAVSMVVDTLKAGGRLIYVGAGTSGRLGILDASECPPTFGTPPPMIQGIIAGGRDAVFRSQEGAEDSAEDGARAIRCAEITARDAVCGIAASRRTPFVRAVLSARPECLAVRPFLLHAIRASSFDLDVDVAICVVVGPEVIMGSTRMKSGTAQKLVLNMITTAAMIRLGKVYENMMVDLQMGAQKLIERSKRTVMSVTGLDYEAASRLLIDADGHVKTALVMHLADISLPEARRRLEAAQGFVRRAVSGP